MNRVKRQAERIKELEAEIQKLTLGRLRTVSSTSHTSADVEYWKKQASRCGGDNVVLSKLRSAAEKERDELKAENKRLQELVENIEAGVPDQDRRIKELERSLNLAKSFHEVAVEQRDYERVENKRLQEQFKQVQEVLVSGTVYEKGEPSYYNGDITELFKIAEKNND